MSYCLLCFALALCLFARCPLNGKCVLKEDGTTTCQCPDPTSCPAEYKRVCGTNGKTYNNTCHMKVDECRRNEVIGIGKRGSCGKFLTVHLLYNKFVHSCKFYIQHINVHLFFFPFYVL